MSSVRRLAAVYLCAPGSLFILSGLLILGMVLFTAVPSHAQQLTGSVSATVYDQSGAVVPGATVTLKNAASGDIRRTTSDSSGYFTFTAVQPATYTISISAKGFTTWQLSGLVINLGDAKTVPNIALKAGAESTTVEVVADKNVEVPLDTPEISDTLNAQQIEDLSLEGRDAGELLKMMPGAALANGINQGSGFNPKVTGTNSGPVGNYSLNGTQPYGTTAYMLDGANLVDPGNAGTQIANINTDMVQEVKMLTADYGAEYAYGPTIFEAFSKAGGKDFHGEGYFYARNSALNSWESYTKSSYLGTLASATNTLSASQVAAQDFPSEYFYYIGGNVGGPVRFPHFNKSRDKLFFWGGYEYMIQHPSNAIQNYNEPTQDQVNGIFDKASSPSSNNSNYSYAYMLPCQTCSGLAADNNWTTDSAGNIHIPTSDYDPNILGVMKLYPLPNISPNNNNGWSNYAYAPSIPQNRWEATGRLDYDITENTKLSGTYAYQSEVDSHPITIWWAPPNTLPYPAPVTAATNAQVILANFTHQFGPTTTSETVFTLARYINPNKLGSNAANRSTVGMSAVPGLFGHTSTQMPNINGPWEGALSNIDQEPMDGPFNGGSFGALKEVPQLYETVSKVIGTHTAKVGFYWSQPYNSQSSGSDQGGEDQGQFTLGWPAKYGTNNVVSDFELGRITNYEQQSGVPLDNFKMAQWSLWAQDSWKANRRLTLNLGMRADHIGQWYGEPNGQQVWDPASYVDSATAAANTGLKWHSIDSSVPLSGFSSPLFYYNPRVGLIYDIFGTGRTLFRTGFGGYHYQISVNEATNNNVGDGPKGIVNYTTPNAFVGYANVATGGTPPTAVSESSWLGNNKLSADLMGDDRTPFTGDWNVSIDQATPWQGLVEISYVGNHTTGEEFNGGNGNINNLNNIAPGGYWKPDPITGKNCSASAPSSATNGCTQVDFGPLHNYGPFYLLTHQSYEKYNSVQASWKKNGAKLNFQANYTFGKVMGIWDGDTSNGTGNGATVWPYAIAPNYGPLDYDHTNIFNVWYVYNLPSPIHGNRLLATAINEWKLSGWNTYQSGGNLQANLPNLNAGWPSAANSGTLFTLPNGLPANGMNASTWLGTPSVNNLMPLLTCNPAKGKKPGFYYNASCFATPSVIGTEGPLHWPYMRLPAYYDNDLSIFKSFPTAESQRLELRVQAQNFINHPLPQFNLNGSNSDDQISFQPNVNGTSGCTSAAQCLGTPPVNASTSGKPLFTTGQRLMTFSARYFF
jgi:hypothetical protein